jgi:hypothetical protein
MALAGFEPTVSAVERPHIYALDSSATGPVVIKLYCNYYYVKIIYIVIIVEGQGICYVASSGFFSCLVTPYQLITLIESYVYDTSCTCITTTIHMILVYNY